MIQKIDRLNNEVWENATNNPSAALKKAEQALELSISNDYQLGQAESLLNIGRCRIFTAEYNLAKTNLDNALDLFHIIPDERAQAGGTRTLNALGVASFDLQDYEGALNYYFMALTESEVSQNLTIQIQALNNIGEIHRILNNIEEALSYFHKAFQFAEDSGNKLSTGTIMINLGEVYLKLGDVSEAADYFTKSLELTEKNNQLQLKADSLFGLGKTQIMNEEYFGAEDKITDAFKIYTDIDDKISIAECHFQFGLIGFNNRKYEGAKDQVKKAESIARELNQIELLSRCIKKLSEICKAEEKHKESLEYFEEFYRLEEMLGNDALRNRLKKITILYETEQTETEKEAYRMQSLNLEKSNKEIKIINEIGQKITSSLNFDEIIFNTFTQLNDIIDISSFSIALVDNDAEKITFTNIIENGERIEPFTLPADSKSSLVAWCIKNHKPAMLSKKEDSKKYLKQWRSSGSSDPINSAIFMPMIQGSKMVGCLTVQNSKENVYTENDLDIIGAVSTFLAIALDNSRTHTELNNLNDMVTSEKKDLEVAYRKIAHMANHDTLTDLPNRHLLHELLDRGLRISKREKTRLAVLYLDLDHFKPINDTLGHESGDIVLKIVAERLIETLRTSDTIARIGGDEFVAVLSNIDSEEGAMSASQKIIASLGKELVLKGRTFRIGVSIGIALFPENDTSIEGLMLKADKAMYKAKQSGRNQAIFFNK